MVRRSDIYAQFDLAAHREAETVGRLPGWSKAMVPPPPAPEPEPEPAPELAEPPPPGARMFNKQD